MELARRFAGVFAAIGVHPSKAEDYSSARDALTSLAKCPEVKAIGEVGLDFLRDGTSEEVQRDVFRAQLKWSVTVNLPVVIHDREAHEAVLELLQETGARGVLHCFSGDAVFAGKAVELGMFLSFAGNLTYKSSEKIRDAVRVVPLDRILVETDSPYLPPQGWRGQRNEPAHIPPIIEAIADIRDCKVGEVVDAIWENAGLLFNWN